LLSNYCTGGFFCTLLLLLLKSNKKFSETICSRVNKVEDRIIGLEDKVDIIEKDK
jgi:hypothetical protein